MLFLYYSLNQGAGVLNMMHSFLGEDTFKRSITVGKNVSKTWAQSAARGKLSK